MAEMSGLSYRCSAGETFDAVALSVYGDEKYAAELMSANPALVGTLVFSGDERLLLPVVVKPEGKGGYAASTAPWR